jgi:hypothetical protein
MKTDDLIRGLATDTVKHQPLSALLFPGILAAAGFSILMLWATLGFRADLVQSLGSPVSVMRFLLTGTLSLLALRVSLNLARPDGRRRANLAQLGFVGLVAVGLLVWAYVTTPAEGLQMAIVGKTMTTCLIMIPLLSIIPVAVILAMMRKGASTVPALSGFVAGLGGSGLAAAVYAMHCTEDSPLFYVTWYGLAISGVAVLSALIGSRLLRW